jgi:hypothetical protein
MFALLHEQRGPFRDFRWIGGELHVVEKMVGAQGFMSGSQKPDIMVAVHKTQMGHGLDEGFGSAGDAGGDGVAPKLFGLVEQAIDFEGFVHGYGALSGHSGGVTEFAQSGVAGAGIMPAVGAFRGEGVRGFENLQSEARVQFLQEDGEVC